MSVIANGEYEGMTLQEYIDKFGRDVIGSKLPQKDLDKFPLLIKFIDANDRLSVQVHPDDEYAYKNENGELGKNEMWYILDTEPGAKLVAGIAQGVTKEIFKQAIENNKVEECLNYISVKPGDFINIPEGLVHAIGKGIILAEVQQNSDTTYRVYDYNRVGADGKTRELHVEKSLETIDFAQAKNESKNIKGLKIAINENVSKTVKIANKYFSVELYKLNGGSIREEADGSKFYAYIVCKGAGSIVYSGGEIPIKMGETILIPANMGKYEIKGTLEAIKTYVPDLKTDVVEELLKSGYSAQDIENEIEGI